MNLKDLSIEFKHSIKNVEESVIIYKGIIYDLLFFKILFKIRICVN